MQAKLNDQLKELVAGVMYAGKRLVPCITGDGKAMLNANFQEERGFYFFSTSLSSILLLPI